MKFEPHEDYECLKKQAYALHNIIECQAIQISVYRKTDYALSERRLSELEKALESERAMNHILTKQLEELKINNTQQADTPALKSNAG
jgi:hypothetical protein